MSTFNRLTVKTLADQALEMIEAAIVRGELPPGAKVSDIVLARSFGISRGPVREALQRLEGRKLVRHVPHVGTTVVALSWEDLVEIFFIREALEGMACRLATQCMTPQEVAELEAVLERHHESDELRSGAAYYQAPGDLDFHYRIARGSRNRRLASILCDELYSILRVFRYQAGATPGRARQAFDEHQQIVAAMRARDDDLAEALMRAHVARARTILQEKSRTAPLSAGSPGEAAAAEGSGEGPDGAEASPLEGGRRDAARRPAPARRRPARSRRSER